MKSILQDLSLSEIEDLLKEYNEPSFRAKQIYSGLQQGKNVEEISTISKELKAKLNDKFCSQPIKIHTIVESKDGTKKFVYELSDGNLIEGVVLSYKYGNTICVSTQVGCRMGCKFCASTLGGLVRNLTSGEILGQVLTVNRLLGGNEKDRKITNIVLMGSGEPLDNYQNVTKFLSLVSCQEGINISQRNISLSTCGIVPKIKQLAEDGFSVTLTISLHAPFDDMRKELMPIANSYYIDEIVEASNFYFKKTGRRVVFEYALIKDKNDKEICVSEIGKKFKGFPLHFNIIPLNDVKERNLLSAGRKASYVFAEKLSQVGVSATVRRTMGEDIEGACGQLRNKVIGTE